MRNRSPSEKGWLGLSRVGCIAPILIVILLGIIVCLPPFSLPQRLMTLGYTTITTAGASTQVTDGAELIVPEGALAKDSAIKLSSVPASEFSKDPRAGSLPQSLEVKSPLYAVSVSGERPKSSKLNLPIPDGADPLNTLDLYGYYNNLWFKLPFVLIPSDQRLEATLNFVPDAAVIVQTQAQPPTIGAEIASTKPAPTGLRQVAIELNPTGLELGSEGTLAGDVIASPELTANAVQIIVPTISNGGPQRPRVDLTENMLFDSTLRKQHVNALVDFTVQKLYHGINLDYQGLTSNDRDDFTAFVKELGSALHAKGKLLSVTLPEPRPVSEDSWDTDGYDWALVGRYADLIKIPLLADVKAYSGDNKLIAQYMQWSVGQIERSKLQFVFTPLGRDVSGTTTAPITYKNALALFGPATVPQPLQPNQAVTLDLPKLRDAGGIKLQADTGLYYFTYKDDKGAAHTVWLENADSLAKKVALSAQYNLRGVVLHDSDATVGMDNRLWDTLKLYQQAKVPSAASTLTIVWLVDGKAVGKAPATDPKLSWTAPDQPGDHTVEFAFSTDGGASTGAAAGTTKIQIALAPTPTPTPKPTEPPPTPKPTTVAVAPQAQPTPKPAAPSAPPASVGVNRFGYGIQVSGGNVDGEMGAINGMGFGWVKLQVVWKDAESSKGNINWGGMEDFVNKAAAKNIKVLFSIVKAPDWSRADHGSSGLGPPDNNQDAADFMGNVAAHFCGKGLGAIEVWNEHNLLTEWHGKPLSAALYMDMLKKSYAAIKGKCSSVVVVSGAPTPTGWNDGVVAIDDGVFLEQLYQNGLKDYSDAIGAHPSGFNVPALCDDLDPACTRPGVSFQGPYQNRHHSWSFLSTMKLYRNIMVKYGDGNKQVWATEFGWPVGTGGGAHPAGADNSYNDLAKWFPDSFRWAKSQGWVGVMFVWNLDFSGGEVGAFHIQGTPAYDALAGMAK